MTTRRLPRSLAIIICPILILTAASCGSDDDDTSATEPAPVTNDTSTVEPADTSTITDDTSTVEPAESDPTATTTDDTTTTEPAEPAPIRFASIESAGQSAVPKVMTDEGIAADNGLEVDIVAYAQPGQQYTLIQSGEADVIAGNILDLHRQRDAGTDIQAFWGFQGYNNPIVVLPDSDIVEFGDLEGRTIGQFGTTFLDWLALRAAGQGAYGIDLETDAELVNASPPLLNQALDNGEVDATLQFSSLALAPVFNGEQRVVTTVYDVIEAAGLDPDSLYLVWIISEEWLNENPGGLEQLQTAMAETYDVLDTDDSVWPDLAALVGITDPALVDAFVDAERDHINPPFNATLLASTQDVLDAMNAVVGTEVTGIEQLDPAAFAFPAE